MRSLVLSGPDLHEAQKGALLQAESLQAASTRACLGPPTLRSLGLAHACGRSQSAEPIIYISCLGTSAEPAAANHASIHPAGLEEQVWTGICRTCALPGARLHRLALTNRRISLDRLDVGRVLFQLPELRELSLL